MIPYVKAQAQGKLPIKGTTLTLSALSIKGNIMFPIKKDEQQKLKIKKDSNVRNNLIAAARRGDEEAIETLTLEDMDMYTTISRMKMFSVWWIPTVCLTVWSVISIPSWVKSKSAIW